MLRRAVRRASAKLRICPARFAAKRKHNNGERRRRAARRRRRSATRPSRVAQRTRFCARHERPRRLRVIAEPRGGAPRCRLRGGAQARSSARAVRDLCNHVSFVSWRRPLNPCASFPHKNCSDGREAGLAEGRELGLMKGGEIGKHTIDVAFPPAGRTPHGLGSQQGHDRRSLLPPPRPLTAQASPPFTGDEVGYYYGCALAWKELQRLHPAAFSERRDFLFSFFFARSCDSDGYSSPQSSPVTLPRLGPRPTEKTTLRASH